MPSKRHLIFLDFETYYDREYSLRKMPTPNYILDPRFEMQMCAVKAIELPDSRQEQLQVRAHAALSARYNPNPADDHKVIEGPDFPAWLKQFDPALTTTVTFNALFDNSILAWKYGFVPSTMLDAMGMARALLGHELASFSLKNVADYLNLGAKGTALQNMMGLRLEQIKSMGLYNQFAQYATQDNYLCEQIFLRLYPQFPRSERRLMDMVLRCTVQPRFVTDVPMLTQHLDDVREAKEQLLRDANNVDPKILMSTKKFQEALEARGVEIEFKTSPSGALAPAFAKTDAFMEDLQNHEDPEVAAMAAARIGFKSTLEETRTEKLLRIGELPWENHFCPPHAMPMPLRYGAAHTHRLGGEWGMNVQNMPTVRGSKGKSKLRQSLIAPPGHTVVTCDLSQIEARLVAWICGCTKLVDEFANKKDPYSILASEIFGRPINRKLPGMEIEGFIGKTGILGLGYGCGKDNFDTMVTRSARAMGMDISQKYNRDIGDRAVDAYRRRYGEIPRGWQTLNGIVSTAWLSGSAEVRFGPVTITRGEVKLPSGLSLKYADPKETYDLNTGYTEYRYRYGKMWHKLYGAKFLENIVQALARIVVMNAALRIRDRGHATINPQDYMFCLQAHDELVFIIRNEDVDSAKKIIHEEMTRRPSWAPDAPIDAELGQGANYGAAK